MGEGGGEEGGDGVDYEEGWGGGGGRVFLRGGEEGEEGEEVGEGGDEVVGEVVEGGGRGEGPRLGGAGLRSGGWEAVGEDGGEAGEGERGACVCRRRGKNRDGGGQSKRERWYLSTRPHLPHAAYPPPPACCEQLSDQLRTPGKHGHKRYSELNQTTVGPVNNPQSTWT